MVAQTGGSGHPRHEVQEKVNGLLQNWYIEYGAIDIYIELIHKDALMWRDWKRSLTGWPLVLWARWQTGTALKRWWSSYHSWPSLLDNIILVYTWGWIGTGRGGSVLRRMPPETPRTWSWSWPGQVLSIQTPSIVGCIFQHKIHGNTPSVHVSVVSDSPLPASPATSVHSLWVEISGWLMANAIANSTGWLLYQGQSLGLNAEPKYTMTAEGFRPFRMNFIFIIIRHTVSLRAQTIPEALAKFWLLVG